MSKTTNTKDMTNKEKISTVFFGEKEAASSIDDPWEAVYVLRGSAEELEAVKTLVHELTNRYGTPDNELGLYVPMEILMQTLVGSKYYRGNLMSMDTDSPDCIRLRAEANSPEPLLYAFRQAFPNLEVEIKDEE